MILKLELSIFAVKSNLLKYIPTRDLFLNFVLSLQLCVQFLYETQNCQFCPFEISEQITNIE